jgi:hypothetical protein
VELGDELAPCMNVVVGVWLDIQPFSHVSSPFLHQWSLDQCKGKGDLGIVGSEGWDLVVKSEVGVQTVYE